MKKKTTISLEIYEETYRLNLFTQEKDVLEFARASWNLSALFLSLVSGLKQLTPKQKVCLYTLGKSMRLLRSIDKLVNTGYWPEAEILFRTLFETQVLHAYILREKSDKRAKAWFERTSPKERWPVSETLKELDKAFEVFYTNISLYPHSHIISVMKYIQIDDDGNFRMSQGPVEGPKSIEQGGNVLGSASMTNASICEVCIPYFNVSSEWQDKHIELMNMPYFQSRQPMVKEFLSNQENVDLINKFFNKKDNDK